MGIWDSLLCSFCTRSVPFCLMSLAVSKTRSWTQLLILNSDQVSAVCSAHLSATGLHPEAKGQLLVPLWSSLGLKGTRRMLNIYILSSLPRVCSFPYLFEKLRQRVGSHAIALNSIKSDPGCPLESGPVT